MMNTHYSPSMDQVKLLTFAQQASKILHGEGKLDVPLIAEDRRPVFVYTGMSGIGMVTGLAMYLHVNHPDFKFAQLYVRKPGEKSHGLNIEMSANHAPAVPSGSVAYRHFLNKTCYPILIDDCISSGMTFGRIFQALRNSCIEWPITSWRALLEDGYSYRFNFNTKSGTDLVWIDNDFDQSQAHHGYQSYSDLLPKP